MADRGHGQADRPDAFASEPGICGLWHRRKAGRLHRTLKVRGAPTIGVAAAYGLCLAANNSLAPDVPALIADLHAAAETCEPPAPLPSTLLGSRRSFAGRRRGSRLSGDTRKSVFVLAAAHRIDLDNQDANLKMGLAGPNYYTTAWSSSPIATQAPWRQAELGSALGLIYTAQSQGQATSCVG